MTQRIFNVQPSLSSQIAEEERATLDPDIDDLFPRVIVGMIPPRSDQGSSGTCVAHMAYNLYSHHFKQRYGRFPSIGLPEINAFYDLCVRVEGRSDPERSDGLWPVTAMRVMRGSGFPLADGSRGPHISGFQYVGPSYSDVRRSIAQFDDPVGVALSWDANWIALPATKVLRSPVGQIIGGHALVAFGYDDAYWNAGETEALVNSWGRTWGPNGTCYLKDDYTSDRWFEAWRVTGIQ